jgi:hypothetical protein
MKNAIMRCKIILSGGLKNIAVSFTLTVWGADRFGLNRTPRVKRSAVEEELGFELELGFAW